MNFASDYVYAKKRLPMPAPPGGTAAARAESFFYDDSDLDTNVVSARFDQLVERSNTYTGDFYACTNCSATLSHISKVSEPNPIDRKRRWICDFCHFENKIFIEDEEVPKKDEVTYILEAPTEKVTAIGENIDSKYLIYCIDISGSMSVTTEVNGRFNLPTDEIRRQSMMNATGEHMPRTYTKHISRLEAVQVAIEENLNKLEKDAPEKKVGLIAFNQCVNVIGDGKIDEIKMIDIEDKESIKKVADRTPEFEKIQKNKDVLSKKLLNLEEGGATALGPALYYSILIASRKKGSQVILCTDGLANKGVGSLENPNQEELNKFYNEMAELALAAGVSVSIITIEGTTCKVGILGEIANKTGGTVNIVNPIRIKEEFSSILEEQIIATNVRASLILPKAMYIKDHANINNKQSSITKEIGNVTKETEITFEFALREDADIDLKITKELPFQLKIIYDSGDGKYIRVLTQLKKLTEDKRVAENNSDRTILASHAIQTSSNCLQRNINFGGRGGGMMNKFSSYIKKLNPLKEDNFSKEAYERVENDLVNLKSKSESKATNFGVLLDNHTNSNNNLAIESVFNGANNFEALDDFDANVGYRLNKFKSKDVKK